MDACEREFRGHGLNLIGDGRSTGIELDEGRPDGRKAGDAGQSDLAASEDLLESLVAKGGESMAKLMGLRHVVTRLSDEGVVIDIFDSEDGLIFEGDGTEPTQLLVHTLAIIGEVLGLVTNDVAVAGAVSSPPVVRIDRDVWKISTGRADATRAWMEGTGFPAARMQRVTGFGDRKPVDRNRTSRRNNRIEITVLRDDV